MGTGKLQYSIKKIYIQITTSIAFYPTMITLGMLILSWISSYLDQISIGKSIINEIPFLKIEDANTVRSLLSSLLTGLISLVTFTFTMVMIVLSQVTSNFSPRLLPDLVSRKGNQVVLGVIIGSICFIIVTLSNVNTMSSGPKVPLLSVAISMYLGFICLLAFIYFIHRVSNDIQIGNILNKLYRATRDVLDRELDSGSYFENWEEKEEFTLVRSWDSGYFDVVSRRGFVPLSKKKGLKLRLLKTQGMYLLKGDPFLEINIPLTDEIRKILEENVIIRHQENVEVNFFYGFKQLTEVAVKALSPAINDPGTAIQSIDYQMDLFRRFQQLKGQKVIRHEDGTASIIYAPLPFENTLYSCLASIRAYSAKDVTVQARLIKLIGKLYAHDEQKRHHKLLESELESIEEASSKEMKSQKDIDFIKAFIQKVRMEYMS